MIQDVLGQVKSMRSSVRSLVFLYWMYSFVGSMVGVFTQIYLYKKFSNLEFNIIASIVFYSGLMIGFCVPGYVAALWRLSIKNGFLLSFFVTGAAIVYILHTTSMAGTYMAMALWGAGQGLFWLTQNTFELSEVLDAERDFYSSVLSAGNQIFSLVGPAFATFLIWLSGYVLQIGTFTLLFTVAPFVYLLGFFCFSLIKEYRPNPIRTLDLKHFFLDRRNQLAQLYTLGTGFQQFVGITIPPLALLYVLGTPLRVGVYDVCFAIFSTLCILVLSRYRSKSNRLFIYGITTTILVFTTVFFGYQLTLLSLVVYTIFNAIVSPLANISSHVIGLESMNIGREDRDFYPTMLLRDFFLWVWRVVGGLVFLAIAMHTHSDQQALSFGLYFLAASLLLCFVGAFFLLRTIRSHSRG